MPKGRCFGRCGVAVVWYVARWMPEALRSCRSAWYLPMLTWRRVASLVAGRVLKWVVKKERCFIGRRCGVFWLIRGNGWELDCGCGWCVSVLEDTKTSGN